MAGPVVWNSLPAGVCEADTLYSFKRKLRTHLFTLCLNDLSFYIFYKFFYNIPGPVASPIYLLT